VGKKSQSKNCRGGGSVFYKGIRNSDKQIAPLAGLLKHGKKLAGNQNPTKGVQRGGRQHPQLRGGGVKKKKMGRDRGTRQKVLGGEREVDVKLPCKTRKGKNLELKEKREKKKKKKKN